jgi:ABC-type transport system involved in cytochrome c biogenesis permease subunit
MAPEIPNLVQIVLLLVAIADLVIGGVISLSRLRSDKSGLRIAAKSLMYFGLVFALAALVLHCVGRRSCLPLQDNFSALTALGILLVVFVLYTQRWRPISGLDWFIMPIAVLMFASAIVFGKFRPDIYRPDSLWKKVHLISTFGGALAFAVAAGVGTMYLVVSGRLRKKSTSPGIKLGSLERLENVAQSAAGLGFALLTLGMITGLVKVIHEGAHTQLGPHWLTSPKVVLAFCVWVVYAMALHSPITPGMRGRKSAVLSIVGFLLMFGALIAAQFMPGGH